MQIAVGVFPDFTALDVVGPYQVFGRRPVPGVRGQTGQGPVFAGALGFDLELIDIHLLDRRHTQELTYRPTVHPGASWATTGGSP